MKIVDVVCSAGRTGFYFDDQRAIKQGAGHDGMFYVGSSVTEGFTAVRQAGESISVMLVLEDGQIAYGDCAAVQYSGAGGRDPLFLAQDFIPIIGSGTVMVPWAVIDVLTGNWVHAVGLMVVWGIVCVFRRVAEPKAVGSQTGLSPILSLVSMYVGMRLAGVLGMILGPVLCLVLINVCRTGIFDGLLGDLRLAVRDTAAILNGHPARRPPAPGGGTGAA